MNKIQKIIMSNLFQEFIQDWQTDENDFKDQDMDKFWEAVRQYVDINTEIYRQDHNKLVQDQRKGFVELLENEK